MKLLYIFAFFGLARSLLDSQENDSDTTDENPVTYVFSTKSGLQFTKKNLPWGYAEIIHDCFVGLKNEGVIDLMDEEYPEKMRSLVIKNCLNITIHQCESNSHYDYIPYNNFEKYKFLNFESLTIKNVEYLNFKRNCHCQYRTTNFSILKNLTIYISNVSQLYVEPVTYDISCNYYRALKSLKLKQVKSDVLHENSFEASEVIMDGVQINVIRENAISCKSGVNTSLSVRNSHFGDIETNGINCLVFQAEFYNNSFQNLGPVAFSIVANESFIFSGNYIKNLSASFKVSSSEFSFSWNTINRENYGWISNIRSNILSITNNTFGLVSDQFLRLKTQANPDFLIIQNNYVNCSCKNWILFSGKDTLMLAEKLFFHDGNMNVCINFGHCLASRFIGKQFELCSTNLMCPEAEHFLTEREYLKLISMKLQNMTETLSLIAQNQNRLLNLNQVIQEPKSLN